jgi:cbb3-type cytochrome oxidase maturation protein
MDSLYLLIPVSALFVLAVLAVFGWALNSGQFEDLEREAERILTDERQLLDASQSTATLTQEQSAGPPETPN